MDVNQFINELKAYVPATNVFNPWRECDSNYDLPDAPVRRRENLKRYLNLRVPNAKYIFVAEALGFQGGKFSGIPMTSERIITGKCRGVSPNLVFPLETNFDSIRSSNRNLNLKAKIRKRFGFAEPTATTVWRTSVENGLDPFQIILWNIFPFHPFNPDLGTLNNRPLNIEEDDLITGVSFVQKLIEMNPRARIIAVGNPSKFMLNEYEIPFLPIAHPSMGGTRNFKSGLSSIINIL